jgi:hypothetical protein
MGKTGWLLARQGLIWRSKAMGNQSLFALDKIKTGSALVEDNTAILKQLQQQQATIKASTDF